MHRGKAWIEVSAARLRHNLSALRDLLDSASPPSILPESLRRPALLAVIKANAYGHGATLCAPILAHAGAEWLGVTDPPEGVAVRHALSSAGIPLAQQPRILVMCGLQPEDAPAIAVHHLTPVVWQPQHLLALAAHALHDRPLALHLEIDTGMARQGARPGPKLAEILATLARLPQLRLDGILTHFASSEVAGSPLTSLQAARFEHALAQLETAGVQPNWLHAGNTSTLDEARLLPWLSAQATRRNARLLARSGLALYGYALPLEGADPALAPSLLPVATWKARILTLTRLSPGETVGYNATFTATRPMQLALLPVGYADGLRRELSSTTTQPGGHVIVHGQQAPIVGRISMNLTTVDVTGIPAAAADDEVTLLGPGITAIDHARLAHTIPYEILCGLRSPVILVD